MEYYVRVINELDIYGVSARLEEVNACKDPGLKLIETIRTILWNVTDSSQDFGEAVCETDMLFYLMRDLDEINREGIDNLRVMNIYRLCLFNVGIVDVFIISIVMLAPVHCV